MISAMTALCGVIGDPVEHTLSPAMHNAAMSKLGLDCVYLAFRVEKARLGAAVEGMRALGLRGLNVTIPHKVAVIPFLDEMDEMALDIGAVNTIVNEKGRLKGYNTDSSGFIQALLGAGFEAKGKRVVLLGAGGAARAVGFALARRGARLTILNRKEELDWAVALAQGLSRVASEEIKALELEPAKLKATLKGTDLLVNATSAGMNPEAGETPVPAELLRPGLAVFDIVYSPQRTRLLREAEERGCAAVSGLEMLVQQGALAFELWTGQKAPLDVMRQAALSALNPIKIGKIVKKTGEQANGKTSVALIGFMGAGKSSVGKALAKKLGRPSVDIDKCIENKAGKSIARVFAEDGEPAFRKLELTVTAEAARKTGQVIACGGGVVLNSSNMDNLKRNAVVVYLKAMSGAIKKRVASGRGKRPLLSSEQGLDAVDTLMSVREPLYEQAADITLDTSKLGIEATVDAIIDRLKEYEGFSL